MPGENRQGAFDVARCVVSALILALWAGLDCPAQQSRGAKTAGTKTGLSEEEKQILRDRELLENMELLGNFEQVRYLEFFTLGTPIDTASKPPDAGTGNKDKAVKNGTKKKS